MKDKSKRKVFAGFSLNPQLAARVADQATKEKRSKTSVVELALEAWFSKGKKS